MKRRLSNPFFILFFALSIFFPLALLAVKKGPSKAERFFDLDKNGILSPYERGLLTTHQHFGWELANTKKRREFDTNGDRMLSPFEWEKYKNRKQEPEEQKKRREKIHYRKTPVRQ